MNRAFRYLVGIGLVLSVVLLSGDGANGFLYFVVDDAPVVWPGATSERYLSPTSFPPESAAETLIAESMFLWKDVRDAAFEYRAFRLDQDYPIDHFDGFNDTAVVPASQLDPGVIGVTYLVNDGNAWFDMDVLFSNDAGGPGYTLDPNPDCEIVANPLTYGYSILLVGVHEMGHALGLGHNPIGDEPPGTEWFIATMNPAYPTGGPVGQFNIVEVHTDDRNGVRFLYPPAAPEDPPMHDLALAGYSAQETLGSATPLYLTPPSILPGKELTAQSVIENFGTADETSVRQGFYLSSDAVIDAGDDLIGALVWDLEVGSGAQFEALITLPDDLPAGEFYFGSILDDLDEVAEIYEDNNAISYCQTLTIEQLAPVIESPAAQIAPCGGPFQLPAPTLTHPLNMSPITWALEDAPDGMTINASSGVVSWTSTLPAPAPYAVTIRATNGAGSTTAPLDLTVTAGDTSGNGTIDLADLSPFTDCLSGPDAGVNPGCECSDLDGDGDTDLEDISAFLTVFEN